MRYCRRVAQTDSNRNRKRAAGESRLRPGVGLGRVGVAGQRVQDPVGEVEEQEGERKAFARDLVDAPRRVLAVVRVVADGDLDGRRW